MNLLNIQSWFGKDLGLDRSCRSHPERPVIPDCQEPHRTSIDTICFPQCQ